MDSYTIKEQFNIPLNEIIKTLKNRGIKYYATTSDFMKESFVIFGDKITKDTKKKDCIPIYSMDAFYCIIEGRQNSI